GPGQETREGHCAIQHVSWQSRSAGRVVRSPRALDVCRRVRRWGFRHRIERFPCSSISEMPQTIAVVATGEMGSAVGAALVRRGHRVITDLTGRSAASRALAAEAGIEDVGSVTTLVEIAEIVLSIVPPAVAPGFARTVATALEKTGARPVFVDCNAVAPATVAEIASPFDALGTPFVDAGIVGPAPRADRPPVRFYVSGRARAALLALDVPEIKVIDMGDEVGRASAIKMCYAALNKGFDALLTSVLLAAERLGVR